MIHYCLFPSCDYKTGESLHHIKQHYKTHKYKYLYKCDYKKCKISFKEHYQLRKHRINVHHERIIDYIIKDN